MKRDYALICWELLWFDNLIAFIGYMIFSIQILINVYSKEFCICFSIEDIISNFDIIVSGDSFLIWMEYYVMGFAYI